MKKVICFLLIFVCFSGYSQLKTVVNKTNYPFWLYLPDNFSKEEKLSILVFLHGKSLSGTDLNKVKRYGVINEIEKGRDIKSIVIAPQTTDTWNPDFVLEIIEYVQKMYVTDLDRVYVCGMSMGGNGTLKLMSKYPEKVTAGVAICGGTMVNEPCNLATLPLWVIHGDKDIPVPIEGSKVLVEKIFSCNKNAPLTFTIVKGGTHSSVENYFHNDAFYDWLFSHKKSPSLTKDRLHLLN